MHYTTTTPSMSLSSSTSTPLTRQSSAYSLHIEDIESPLLDSAIRNVDIVLASQAKALSVLTSQYRSSTKSINQLKTSLRYLNNSLNSGGKIIVSGMGKSYKIASKTVATMNSLKIHSALLHPSEALHGDLGMIRDDHNDSIIIISASGNSPELLQMLEHIPLSVPIILMTCSRDSTLARHPKVVSLILAEIPSALSESNIYGLTAPTISTTLCLTILDAVSIALGELYISDLKVRKETFATNHPGGAIGINHKLEKLSLTQMHHSNTQAINSIERSTVLDTPVESSQTEKTSNNNDDEDTDNHSNVSYDMLNLADLALAKNVDDAKYKTRVSKLPDSEMEILRLVTLNDYIIITGSVDGLTTAKPNTNTNTNTTPATSILDCQVARDVIRECSNQEWPEVMWKLVASQVPCDI